MSVNSSQSIQKILKYRRFWPPDPELTRYNHTNLVDYISYCCDRSTLIEAYTLTLQYVEDLLVLAFKRDKYINNNDASKIVSIINVFGKIDNRLKGLFERVNTTRNDLVHKIINDPSALKKISKRDSKSHEKDLLFLINLIENFYYEFLKSEARNILQKTQLSLNASEKTRLKAFVYIIQERAAKAVKMPEGIDKAELEEKFLEEFDKNFNEEIKLVLKG